jgi:prepilin-type N-terminal cleavage/methylation domain-containing protein
MHRTSSTRQAGFTLIELLLYVAIIGVLLTAIMAFFGLTTGARVKNQSISEVNQQGVSAMDQMLQTIRNATSVTTPTTGTSGSTITVVVPTASLSPTTYSLSGTTLQIVEGTGSAVPLTNSKVQISNLTFKSLGRSAANTDVQVSFTVTRTNTAGRNEYDYSKTFTGTAEVQW